MIPNMKKSVFASLALLAASLFAAPAFSQNTKPTAASTPETQSTPAAAPLRSSPAAPAQAPVLVKSEKNAQPNPNATIDGSAPVPAAPAKPLPVAKQRRVNPADVHPVDLSKVETARPGEKTEQPQATATPFGRTKPVAGQQTVTSPPLKKPANLQPATPEAPSDNH